MNSIVFIQLFRMFGYDSHALFSERKYIYICTYIYVYVSIIVADCTFFMYFTAIKIYTHMVERFFFCDTSFFGAYVFL